MSDRFFPSKTTRVINVAIDFPSRNRVKCPVDFPSKTRVSKRPIDLPSHKTRPPKKMSSVVTVVTLIERRNGNVCGSPNKRKHTKKWQSTHIIPGTPYTDTGMDR